MADSECEIEYLDEDADLVGLHIGLTHPQNLLASRSSDDEKKVPLLVERPHRKRKTKKDDDSDYDPSEDYTPPSPPSPKTKKKKVHITKRPYKPHRNQAPELTVANIKNIKKIIKDNKLLSPKEQLVIRKKLNIRIPDYEDPLCLPVKAIQQEASDIKRLNVWNNMCLEHFKNCDTLLRPERGETKSSSRSVVLRNVVNKQTKKVETTIWSKTAVESEDGEKKSEIFQCVLPRYREKKVLDSYQLSTRKPKPVHIVDEVLLTKEEHKDGEALVVYKPEESLSAVYMLFTKTSATGKEEGEPVNDREDEDSSMYLKEMACCKVCALCFQSSWRGGKRVEKRNIVCPICARTYVTVYNLLAHFKTHSSVEVHKYKRVISAALSELIEYHYKCRICLNKFRCIKALRQHVKTHQGNEMFTCEVGNHLVT